MRLNRRQLTSLLSRAPLALTLTTAVSTMAAADDPNTLLRKAEEDVRNISARLGQVQVAQNVEPASTFHS